MLRDIILCIWYSYFCEKQLLKVISLNNKWAIFLFEWATNFHYQKSLEIIPDQSLVVQNDTLGLAINIGLKKQEQEDLQEQKEAISNYCQAQPKPQLNWGWAGSIFSWSNHQPPPPPTQESFFLAPAI